MLLGIFAPPQLRRDLGFETLANYLDPVTVGYPMALLVCTIFLLGPFSVFKHTVLRWYGKISYSFYLLHMFAVAGVFELVTTGVLRAELGFPVVMLIATVISAASFYGFERPAQRIVRSRLTRLSRRLSFAPPWSDVRGP